MHIKAPSFAQIASLMLRRYEALFANRCDSTLDVNTTSGRRKGVSVRIHKTIRHSTSSSSTLH